MTSYYAETLLYNANTTQQAKKKNREHIKVEQCASKKNNHIIDAVLFIRQQQKQITSNNFHLHSQQWLSS